MNNIRFVFLGMPALFSVSVLRQILRAGIKPSAVWIPSNRDWNGSSIQQMPLDPVCSELPLLNPFLDGGIAELAWKNNIALFAVNDMNAADVAEELRRMDVGVGFVACFPKRIPDNMLAVPKYGFFNLHPSLLPAYRGPHPLFWTFREGLSQSGVTLHHVDSGLDTGDIALQQVIELANGLTQKEAEALFAASGAELIFDALPRLEQGILLRSKQDPEARYYGTPTSDDFKIPLGWSSRRAYNFMCGTDAWGVPYQIHGGGIAVKARAAISYSEDGFLERPLISNGSESWVRFRTGWLHVKDW